MPGQMPTRQPEPEQEENKTASEVHTHIKFFVPFYGKLNEYIFYKANLSKNCSR